MKTPAFKTLQMKLLVHYYGVLPASIFYLFNPTNSSLDHIKNWHNRLVSIADFLEDYFYSIVAFTALLIFFGTLIYVFFLFFPEGVGGKKFLDAWSLLKESIFSAFSGLLRGDLTSCCEDEYLVGRNRQHFHTFSTEPNKLYI